MKKLVVVVLALALLSACSKANKDVETTTTTVAKPTPTTTPIGNPGPVKLSPLARLDFPTSIAIKSDSKDIYVAQRNGIVKLISNGVVADKNILDLSTEVTTDGERGLLGLAFAPNANALYVYFTGKDGTLKVSEFRLNSEGIADLNSRRDLISIPHTRNNHNGGQLTFGPDKLLYIGTGDGGGAGDQDNNAQNLTLLLGKILRIDPRPTASTAYTIPYDNPFVNQSGARGEIWAYGLRNPWRFSFDSANGDLYLADVGQDKWEEINYISKDPKGGQNYGWPLREGLHTFNGDKPSGAIDPVFEYEHKNGPCSITGGYLYRGNEITSLQGRYVFGDYCTGKISTLTHNGDDWNTFELNITVANIVSFAQDGDGEILTLSSDGQISRIING